MLNGVDCQNIMSAKKLILCLHIGNLLVPGIFGDADHEFDFFYLRHLHIKIYNL